MFQTPIGAEKPIAPVLKKAWLRTTSMVDLFPNKVLKRAEMAKVISNPYELKLRDVNPLEL